MASLFEHAEASIPLHAAKQMMSYAANRTGWYEFTHTASNFNITSASSQLSNVTNAVDSAVNAFQSTKSSLVASGNPSLRVRFTILLPSVCQANYL